MRKIRTIKKYGNTIVLTLTSQDLIDMGWKLGDNIDISDAIKVSGAEEEIKNELNHRV